MNDCELYSCFDCLRSKICGHGRQLLRYGKRSYTTYSFDLILITPQEGRCHYYYPCPVCFMYLSHRRYPVANLSNLNVEWALYASGGCPQSGVLRWFELTNRCLRGHSDCSRLSSAWAREGFRPRNRDLPPFLAFASLDSLCISWILIRQYAG